MRFTAIDFETSDAARDSACAIGLVRVEHGVIVERVHRLIRPPRRVFTTTFIHGITWRMVENAPTFGQLWPELAPLCEGVDFLAAHNAAFDKSVLYTCCTAAGITPPRANFQCTVTLARRTWNLKPTKLTDCARFLGVALQHHDALSDATVCAEIVRRARAEGSANA